jgi:hypothetical protein
MNVYMVCFQGKSGDHDLMVIEADTNTEARRKFNEQLSFKLVRKKRG